MNITGIEEIKTIAKYNREQYKIESNIIVKNNITNDMLYRIYYYKVKTNSPNFVKNSDLWFKGRCCYDSPSLTVIKPETDEFEVSFCSMVGDNVSIIEEEFHVYSKILSEYDTFLDVFEGDNFFEKSFYNLFPDFNHHFLNDKNKINNILNNKGVFSEKIRANLSNVKNKFDAFSNLIIDIKLDNSFYFCNIDTIDDLNNISINEDISYIILNFNRENIIDDLDIKNYHKKIIENYKNIKGTLISGSSEQRYEFSKSIDLFNL